LFYCRKGFDLAERLHDEEGMIEANVGIFIAEGLKRNDVAAVKTLLETQKLAEAYGNDRMKDYVKRQAGFLYMSLGDYKKSLQYFFSLANSKKNYWATDEHYLAFALGQVYYELNILDSALLWINKDLEAQRKSGSDWGFSHNLLGNTYRKMKNYGPALQELHTALFLAINQQEEKIDIIKAKISLAETFYATGNYDSSLYYARAAMLSHNFDAFPDLRLQTFTLLKNLYAKRNSVDSAYKYISLSLNLKDSIFNADKIKGVQRAELEQEALAREVKTAIQNRVKIYSLVAGMVVFLVIALLLWRNNRHRQKAYALLQQQKEQTDQQKIKTEYALQELKATQAQLIQSEKMASLGELTAGIAHEIQNPLNFVNNFSEVNTELIEELKGERSKVIGERNEDLEEEILNDIKENEQKISYHGKRADAIVKGMLQHTRVSTAHKEPTDINALADEYLRLSYHGLRAKNKDFNPTLQIDFDESIGRINVVPQDIGRVLLNLYNNAFYATKERAKKSGGDYQPVVTVTTKKTSLNMSGANSSPSAADGVAITVRDNGTGIPQTVVDKIFQPFFTTKPAGQGTGLGLSLSYDIIKAHGGELEVDTKEGEGAEFIIQLPTTGSLPMKNV
jgi:signal transduction histidine kinase